jgi:hypothetical protein
MLAAMETLLCIALAGALLLLVHLNNWWPKEAEEPKDPRDRLW